MQYDKKVIDINTHPYLFEDVCRTQEQYQLVYDVTGLYHNGVASMPSTFARLDCAKIDLCVLSPLDLTTTKGTWMTTNEDVEALCKKYPERFLGLASVDPHRPDAVEVLEKAFTEPKLLGVHLFPALQEFSPDEACMTPIYETCLRHDKPILFDCGCSPYPGLLTKYAHPLLVEAAAMKYKKLRICLSRFGWPWSREVCMLMLKCHNVYTDTSIVYFDDAPQMYHQMFTVDMGPKWLDRSLRHQVMFGSGDPGLEQIRMINAVRGLELRDSTKELILSRNALEFLGIEKDLRWAND